LPFLLPMLLSIFCLISTVSYCQSLTLSIDTGRPIRA